MSGFTRQINKTFEFDGDSVVVVAERMKTDDFKLITPFIKQDGRGKIKMSFEDQMQMLFVAKQILPGRVKEVRGLKTVEGEELTINDIVDGMYFIQLAVEIFEFVIGNSSLSNQKKQVVPSGE